MIQNRLADTTVHHASWRKGKPDGMDCGSDFNCMFVRF